MKKHLIIIFLLFSFSDLYAQESLRYYIQKALENNLQLNAERKNFESSKQSKNISRSEFLPSITISGEQNSTTSTNRTNQSGSSLSDSNSDFAQTIKSVVSDKISQGKNEREIYNFLSSKYGDWILYDPKLNAGNFLLWFLPYEVLLAGGIIIVFLIRKRS